MQIYNRYIIRQLIHSTLLITVSLTSIIWLTQALRFIDFIVNQGVSISIFLELTSLLLPALLLVILPPAFFCALIFTYHKLKSDNELVVMQSAGLSRWKLAAPALNVAVGVMAIGFIISLYFQPTSYRQFRDLQQFLRNNYVSILLQEGVFSSPVDGLTVFIRQRNDDGTLKGILVHDSRIPNVATTMLAEQGTLVQTPQGPRFLLVNGTRQEVKGGKISFLNFESYTLDISLFTAEKPTRVRDPQELYLAQLFDDVPGLNPQDIAKRHAEGHQRIVWPIYSVVLTLIGAAVMLSGEFNRRGSWKRVAIAVICGTLLLFSEVGLRGMVAIHNELATLMYVLPVVVSGYMAYILQGGDIKTLVKPARKVAA
jgi:lipopolysaccharide export system permease protein